MTPFDALCPGPPSWRVEWDAINEAFPWVTRMRECPQDKRYHAEGDVWIHTRMVCEALASLPAFRELPADERTILFAAALLHDVSKPDCTRHDTDGSITSRGHARRGEMAACAILWRLGCPFRSRQHVTALVRHHPLPLVLVAQQNPERAVLEVSLKTRCDWLAMLAQADVLGRESQDGKELLEQIDYFRMFCTELNCLVSPYSFASDHSRFVFFRKEDCRLPYAAHDDSCCEVVLLSGLPGAGKDHWLERNLPNRETISLDRVRRGMKIRPDKSQGAVVSHAREAARVLLRKETSFAWNATNLSRQVRRPLIDLFARYRARVRIVYVEVSEAAMRQQNRNRDDAVPEAVVEDLIARRWQIPDLTEAHRVDWHVSETSVER